MAIPETGSDQGRPSRSMRWHDTASGQPDVSRAWATRAPRTWAAGCLPRLSGVGRNSQPGEIRLADERLSGHDGLTLRAELRGDPWGATHRATGELSGGNGSMYL